LDELVVDGAPHVAWDEAIEREVAIPGLAVDRLREARLAPVEVPAGAGEQELHDAAGGRAGAFLRSWRELRGSVTVQAEELGRELHRLTVRIANTSPFAAEDREAALRQTFCSTHAVLRVERGELVSMTDPPERLRAQAERCENLGTWPALVGEEGERHTMLSSPIILPDYPEVAPESPGDMFDAAEIDQLLRLSILTMTDDEKAAMRAADPRAREILERTESLSREELMRLQGATSVEPS
jgi:hypothetical protein